jgi:hypothetical protein
MHYLGINVHRLEQLYIKHSSFVLFIFILFYLGINVHRLDQLYITLSFFFNYYSLPWHQSAQASATADNALWGSGLPETERAYTHTRACKTSPLNAKRKARPGLAW